MFHVSIKSMAFLIIWIGYLFVHTTSASLENSWMEEWPQIHAQPSETFFKGAIADSHISSPKKRSTPSDNQHSDDSNSYSGSDVSQGDTKAARNAGESAVDKTQELDDPVQQEPCSSDKEPKPKPKPNNCNNEIENANQGIEIANGNNKPNQEIPFEFHGNTNNNVDNKPVQVFEVTKCTSTESPNVVTKANVESNKPIDNRNEDKDKPITHKMVDIKLPGYGDFEVKAFETQEDGKNIVLMKFVPRDCEDPTESQKKVEVNKEKSSTNCNNNGQNNKKDESAEESKCNKEKGEFKPDSSYKQININNNQNGDPDNQGNTNKNKCKHTKPENEKQNGDNQSGDEQNPDKKQNKKDCSGEKTKKKKKIDPAGRICVCFERAHDMPEDLKALIAQQHKDL